MEAQYDEHDTAGRDAAAKPSTPSKKAKKRQRKKKRKQMEQQERPATPSSSDDDMVKKKRKLNAFYGEKEALKQQVQVLTLQLQVERLTKKLDQSKAASVASVAADPGDGGSNSQTKEVHLPETKKHVPAVDWKWQDDNEQWNSYDGDVSKAIEACSKDETYVYTYAGNSQTYHIVKKSVNHAEQVNVDSGVMRCVTRGPCVVQQTVHSHTGKARKAVNGKEGQQDDNEDDDKKAHCDEEQALQVLSKTFGKTLAVSVTWQWQDEHGTWKSYADEVEKSIETLKVHDCYKFRVASNKQSYQVTRTSNEAAIQVNAKTGVERTVRRVASLQCMGRKLAASHELQVERKMRNGEEKNKPEWWSSELPVNGDEYCRANLHELDVSKSGIGTKIKEMFDKSCGDRFAVTKVESVENQMLYDSWLAEKVKLTKTLCSGDVNQMYLFHGTKNKTMGSIITEGFRKEFNHTCQYGKGSYFSSSAEYSAQYAETAPVMQMFVCKVLLGKSVLGKKAYELTTWPKQSSGLIYDSLVNSETKPTIYVIHENYRAYPMFIVHYKRKT